MPWMCSSVKPLQRTYSDFLPDTLGGVRQFLCGGGFDAYTATIKVTGRYIHYGSE